MRAFRFEIGEFFLVIGVIMLAIFFVTVQSQSPLFVLLFGGLLVGGFGLSLITRNRAPRTEESARFRRVRRYRQKAQERREKKRYKEQDRRDQKQHGQRDKRGQEQRNQQQQEQRERQP
jgi:hypothetical protein